MRTLLSAHAVSVLLCMCILSATAVAGSRSKDDFELLYPGNNVYHNPFVEFRQRNPGGDSLTGHAFVALGYHLDNGQTAYYAIAGYYRKLVPEQSAIVEHLQAVLGSPGEMSYRIDDWRTDNVLRYPIDESQARRVQTIIQNAELNPGTFTALQNNCVKMMNYVANAVGLKTLNSVTPSIPISPTPAQAIKYIRDNNKHVQTIQQDDAEQQILKRYRDRVESGAAAAAITPLPIDFNGMAQVHADDPLVGPNAGQSQGLAPNPGSPRSSPESGGSGNGWMELYLLGLPGGAAK